MHYSLHMLTPLAANSFTLGRQKWHLDELKIYKFVTNESSACFIFLNVELDLDLFMIKMVQTIEQYTCMRFI